MSNDNHTTYCIYRIVNFTNGNCYIGQTNNPSQRKKRHFYELKVNKHHNQHLQAAYNLYGLQAFYFEVIEDGIAREHANEREIYWLETLSKKHTLYNQAIGGNYNRTKGKATTWNGITYPTLVAAAKANGLSITAMQSRILRGYTNDDDLTSRKRLYYVKQFTWNGQTYPSLTVASKAIGVNLTTLIYYRERGYSCDNDFVKEKPCTWNGIDYKSMAEAARVSGINEGTFIGYIKRGYVCSSDVPKIHNRKRPCVYKGVEYSSICEASRVTGSTRQTIRKYQKDRI